MTVLLERFAFELTNPARLITGHEILAYPFGLGSRVQRPRDQIVIRVCRVAVLGVARLQISKLCVMRGNLAPA
jgi:hypothetical protein